MPRRIEMTGGMIAGIIGIVTLSRKDRAILSFYSIFYERSRRSVRSKDERVRANQDIRKSANPTLQDEDLPAPRKAPESLFTPRSERMQQMTTQYLNDE
jgi:hypothetical protein